MLKQRLDEVRERIARAAARVGRRPNDITLLAVTKKFSVSVIREAYELGLREFGENYVQEFEGKAPELTGIEGARFHLIGHLQSNKSRKAAELFRVIQTVDSPKLVRRLAETGAPLELMIEVKLSEEESKHGAAPEEIAGIVESAAAFPHLQLTGLMTIPPWSEDPETTRPYFARLQALAEEHRLHQLSMGMSQDFEAAIEEGSTLVRVGTALFGARKKE